MTQQVDEKRQVHCGSGVEANVPVPAPFRPRASLPLVVLSSLAVVGAMYFARDVIIPIVFAVLLALLLRPIFRRLRKFHVPDFVAAFVLVAAVVVVFGFGVFTLAGQAQKWLAETPEAIRKVSKMLPAEFGPMNDLAKTRTAMEDLTKSNGSEQPVRVEVHSNDGAYAVLGVSGHFLGASVIVFVLSFFLLALSETLLLQAVQSRPSFDEKRNVVQLVKNVELGISRYLLTITTINIGLGVATGLAMWLLRIPNPVLWGVLAATSNYVPHVGAFICMIVMFVVGSVTHESIGYGALVAATFVALTSAESYFVTPVVLSRSLQLSPLAVLLAILFFGWLWGIPGGLIAAPLLAVLKIICDQFDSLHPLGAFLGRESAEKSAADPPAVATNEAKQAA